MKISDFKSKIQGLATTNNYFVNIIPPDDLKRKFPYDWTSELKLLVQDIDMDFGKITTVENVRHGKTHTVAANWNYDEITMEFMVSSNYNIIDFFTTWKELIVNPITNEVGFYDEYVAKSFEISLTESINNEKDKFTFIFDNAYPSNISSLNLSYDDIDIMKIRITFVYSNLTKKKVRSNVANYGTGLNYNIPVLQNVDTTLNTHKNNNVISTTNTPSININMTNVIYNNTIDSIKSTLNDVTETITDNVDTVELWVEPYVAVSNEAIANNPVTWSEINETLLNLDMVIQDVGNNKGIYPKAFKDGSYDDYIKIADEIMRDDRDKSLKEILGIILKEATGIYDGKTPDDNIVKYAKTLDGATEMLGNIRKTFKLSGLNRINGIFDNYSQAKNLISSANLL